MFNKQTKVINRRFLSLILILVALGLLAVADASAPQAFSVFKDKYYYIKQQLIWVLVGFVGLVVAIKIPLKFWEKIALPLFIINILLLIVVLHPAIGSKVLGARRWIFLGPISIQPSEILKFSLALILAKISSRNIRTLYFIIPIILSAFLIMLQPDLGTTIVICGLGFIQMFVAGINIFYFLGTGIIGLLIGAIIIYFSDYRRQRLMTFLKQTNDPLGSSYHIRQILLALGMGGLTGIGLGASRQKYLFLPEAATDSIFAVIAEEVGFLGSAFIIFLFLFLLIEGFKIAKNAPNRFSQVFAVGIISWIGLQIFLNIGSMVALIPITGIPLPFFSYGGSSQSMILLSCGILLNISRYGVNIQGRRKRR